MALSNVNIMMDNDLKKGFVKLCNDKGLSINAALCALARSAVNQHDIPFKAADLDENGLTPEEVAELKRRYENAEAGNVVEMDLTEL